MPSVPPEREASHDRMQMDSHTIKSLEIRESLSEGGTKGSLLSTIKCTTTASGTRLLARWLCEYTIFTFSLLKDTRNRFAKHIIG